MPLRAGHGSTSRGRQTSRRFALCGGPPRLGDAATPTVQGRVVGRDQVCVQAFEGVDLLRAPRPGAAPRMDTATAPPGFRSRQSEVEAM